MAPIRGLLFPVNQRIRGFTMSGNANLDDMYKAINCTTVERYVLVPDEDNSIVDLWFDEEFLLKGNPMWNRVFALPRAPTDPALSLGGNVLALASFEGETVSLTIDGALQALNLCRGFAPNMHLREEGDHRNATQIAYDMSWRPSEQQIKRWLVDGFPWWNGREWHS